MVCGLWSDTSFSGGNILNRVKTGEVVSRVKMTWLTVAP